MFFIYLQVRTFVNETSLFGPIYNVDSTNKSDLGSSEIENKDVNNKPPGYTDVKKFLQTFKHFHSNNTTPQVIYSHAQLPYTYIMPKIMNVIINITHCFFSLESIIF